jgi:hypothetical protein
MKILVYVVFPIFLLLPLGCEMCYSRRVKDQVTRTHTHTQQQENVLVLFNLVFRFLDRNIETGGSFKTVFLYNYTPMYKGYIDG